MSPFAMAPANDIGPVRFDAGAITAMFAAERIALHLEHLSQLVDDGRFVMLQEVVALIAASLHDWSVSLGDATRPADLRAGSASLRLEADELFLDLSRRRRPIAAIAERARQWADAVRGWAQISGSMAL